jgi:hypothetical protein
MNHLSTAASASPSPAGSPWRLLLLDRDADDPKWLLATIIMAEDVRPAVLDPSGQFAGWEGVTRWIARQYAGPVSLVPVCAPCAWRISEGGPR